MKQYLPESGSHQNGERSSQSKIAKLDFAGLRISMTDREKPPEGVTAKVWDVLLASVVDDLRNDRYREPVEKISAEPDKEKRREMKRDLLLAWMPAGIFSARKDKSIRYYNGLIVADMDDLNTQQLASVKETLKQSPFLLLLFVSPSGNGIKGVFRVASPHEANGLDIEELRRIHRDKISCASSPHPQAHRTGNR